MDYKWARDYALELIDQYSIAGNVTPPTYNNQADYLHKIPRLLDDAQLLCASTRHKLRAAAALDTLPCERRGAWDIYTMPEDCWKLRGAAVLRAEDGGGYVDCRVLEENKIALPAGTGAAGLTAEYFRRPRLLGEAPEEDAELDNTPAVQAALPFYAAAHLVMADNSFVYASLLNEFESRVAAAVPLETERGLIEDSYGEEWE